MRPAHYFTICALLFAGATSALPSLAPEPHLAPAAAKAAAAVFNPAAPTAPLQHQPLATSGAIVTQPGDWKAANGAVAQFPRGHADVLKWEKAQAKVSEKASPTPAHDSTHPSGAKP